jgi:hypothetical protein
MHKALVLALPLLLVSGCLADDGAGESDLGGDDGNGGNATALAPLHFEGAITAGADPFNMVPAATPVGGAAPCSTEASTCYYHDFSVNASADVTATLAWGVVANDIDLYLYQGGTEVSRDGINDVTADPTPVDNQVMHATVAPGDYTFWVVVWNGAADSYTLDVAFA